MKTLKPCCSLTPILKIISRGLRKKSKKPTLSITVKREKYHQVNNKNLNSNLKRNLNLNKLHQITRKKFRKKQRNKENKGKNKKVKK